MFSLLIFLFCLSLVTRECFLILHDTSISTYFQLDGPVVYKDETENVKCAI